MSDSGVWIVPGAPLEDGRGWRIWCSRRDGIALTPPEIRVQRAGVDQTHDAHWQKLDPLPGLNRQAGILEVVLQSPQPGALYDVWVPGAAARPLHWRTLPAGTELGQSDESSFTILLASCFYRPNDAEGAYGGALADLCKSNQVSFKLLVGDQVYQDWPTTLPPPPPMQAFTDRYESYWADDAYRAALALTPNLFVCDDHEFWNDYPERQWHLLNTWTLAQRQAAGTAGRATLDYYQRSANPGGAAFFVLSLPGLSMFVADTRSLREPMDTLPTPQFFNPAQWQAFEAWITALDRPGVIVLGQPLFQSLGDFRDHSLANFVSAYRRLLQSIDACLRGTQQRPPHDLLVLTGDIHWGRYAFTGPLGGATLHEMVSSPAANISSGPFVGSKHKNLAPARMPVTDLASVATWGISTIETDAFPSNDNNVALLRFSAGTNRRTRCEASWWSLRPVDQRHFWQRVLGESPPRPRLRQLFATEVELM